MVSRGDIIPYMPDIIRICCSKYVRADVSIPTYSIALYMTPLYRSIAGSVCHHVPNVLCIFCASWYLFHVHFKSFSEAFFARAIGDVSSCVVEDSHEIHPLFFHSLGGSKKMNITTFVIDNYQAIACRFLFLWH